MSFCQGVASTLFYGALIWGRIFGVTTTTTTLKRGKGAYLFYDPQLLLLLIDAIRGEDKPRQTTIGK